MKNQSLNSSSSYLTFLLSNKEFAVDVEKINNIIELTKITSVKGAPSFMRGTIAHEGNALPVVDFRHKLGMTPASYTMHTCIIIANINTMGVRTKVGLLVDAVQSVLEISSSDIQAISDRRVASFRPYITGKTNYEGQAIKLIDINKAFAKWELESMNAVEKDAHATIQMSMIN